MEIAKLANDTKKDGTDFALGRDFFFNLKLVDLDESFAKVRSSIISSAQSAGAK
jgi:hypothetical protein